MTDRRWIRESHHGAPDIEIPLLEFHGRDGPSLALIAGMHGGEYAGPLAMLRLARLLEDTPVAGRVLIIPVISTRAFFQRAIQLSPVDSAEVHYVWPGSPDTSYSAHLVDLLFRTIRGYDAVVDMHAGEFVQDITPYVAAPWDDGHLFDECLELASAYEVPFVDKRAVAETPLALPRALLQAGIPNIWTEIGHNGLPDAETIRLQFEGAFGLLRNMGIVPGEARHWPQRLVGPRHWAVVASETGVWEPKVSVGQFVRAGQELGRMRDLFGRELRTYVAEADSTVQFICTSPAIDIRYRPGGSTWHQFLVQLVEDLGR